MENSSRKRHALTAADISLTAFCLLIFDVASTGAGRYLTLGWLSPRILLAAVAVLTALPSLFRDLKNQLKNPVNYLIAAFWLYLIAEAARGIANGNNMAVLKSDLMGFAWLFLLPFFFVLLRDPERRRHIFRAAVAGASLQAALCVLCNIVFAGVVPEVLPDFVEGVWAGGWGTILAVEYNAVRIFCRSSLYLIAACALLFTELVRRKEHLLGPAALFLLNFFALFYTYTRSMYLALGAVLLLTLLYLCVMGYARQALLRALILGAAFVFIAFASDLILKQGSFQYAVARCFHRDLNAMLPLPHTWEEGEVDFEEITKNTNETRDTTTEELAQIIREAPVTGHGLGMVVPSRGGSDEYFYHDLIMRTGFVGLFLYLLPFLYGSGLLFIRRKRLRGKEETGTVYIVLIGCLIASYFNPWMNAVIGISWYGLTLTDIREL